MLRHEIDKFYLLMDHTNNGVLDQDAFDRDWGHHLAKERYKSEKLFLVSATLSVTVTLWCFITFGHWWLFAFLTAFYGLFWYQLRVVRKAKAQLWWRTLTGISHG